MVAAQAQPVRVVKLQGAFDMNALPVSAVERVEILKDGASSLYGSDAVAGVINIITKRGDEKSIKTSLPASHSIRRRNFPIKTGTWGSALTAVSYRVCC